MRVFAAIGAISIIALIDGTVSGIVSAMWGDVWGCRLNDLALFPVALFAIWQWTGTALCRRGATT